MKKIFTTTIIILLCISAKTQVVLDTIIHPAIGGMGYDFKTVQISETETKYFRADTSANTFSLYNMDWSPFLINVSVPMPFDPTGYNYQCLYVTRTLFDCDSTNIEYLFTSPNGGNSRQVLVMRTDGTQLFQMDSAFCQYCYGDCLGGSDVVRPIANTSDGAKLFIMRTVPWTGDVYVYNLCGSLPDDIFEFAMTQTSVLRVFPNPTANTLTFMLNPSDNIAEYELILYNSLGQELSRQPITSQSNSVTVDVSDYASGSYRYSLIANGKQPQSGSFILQK